MAQLPMATGNLSSLATRYSTTNEADETTFPEADTDTNTILNGY